MSRDRMLDLRVEYTPLLARDRRKTMSITRMDMDMKPVMSQEMNIEIVV